MKIQCSVGAASWPPMNVALVLLLQNLLSCDGAQYSPSFIAGPTKRFHKKPLLKVSREPPPAHPWAASGLSERVLSAGSLSGAFFHAFVVPPRSEASILNTTAEAWMPLALWGAGKIDNATLPVAVTPHDPVAQELQKEIEVESENRRNPVLSKAPKVSVGLSHGSSSHVRAPGASQASSLDMQDAEFKLMSQLLRDATNFFAFEGSLVLTAVHLSNLHHIHAIEANSQTLTNLMVNSEVQDAIHEGKLVLAGEPAQQDNLFNGPADSCVPGQLQAAFEADWDLIFMGKDCSTEAVLRTLEATSSNARVAVLGLGRVPNEHSILDSCDKVGAAGSLTVFARKNGADSGPEETAANQNQDSSMSFGDAVAPLMHGEGFWPH